MILKLNVLTSDLTTSLEPHTHQPASCASPDLTLAGWQGRYQLTWRARPVLGPNLLGLPLFTFSFTNCTLHLHSHHLYSPTSTLTPSLFTYIYTHDNTFLHLHLHSNQPLHSSTPTPTLLYIHINVIIHLHPQQHLHHLHLNTTLHTTEPWQVMVRSFYHKRIAKKKV